MRTFTVILDISKTTSAGFERWSATPIADERITSRGAGDGQETWHVQVVDQRGALQRAEREIKRSGVAGVSVSSIEERL